MTREEREDAIDIIQSILNKYEEDECLVTEITIGDEDIKAFKMAIEALKKEPMIVQIAEFKYDKDKLKELISKSVLTVTPQETGSEWEHDHEILKAYSDGASEVLDKIRAEITRLRDSWEKDNYHDEADALTTVLAIFDKYKAEAEEV